MVFDEQEDRAPVILLTGQGDRDLALLRNRQQLDRSCRTFLRSTIERTKILHQCVA